jgi:peroxiredoxin
VTLARADALANLTVLDEHGQALALAALWREQAAVLAFVRHFGCLHCREHVAQLRTVVDAMHAAGAELHVIGNGTPNFIAGFRETTGLATPVYTDPTLAVYRAAELRRGASTMLDVRAAAKTVRAFARGHRQSLRVQGDQWQQGGVLVIARDGRVAWQHVSKYPGDNAEPTAIVSALARLSG